MLVRWAAVFPALTLALSACTGTDVADVASRGTDAPGERSVDASITPATETWQYVAMGDSTHRDVAPVFADLIEEELGVEVDAFPWINPDEESYEVGGERAGDMVARLRTDEQLRSDLRDADVITFVVPYGEFSDICGHPLEMEPARAKAHLRACWPEFLSEYRTDVDEFFDELVAIRSPSESLIRVLDHYQTAWQQLHDLGAYEVVRPFWREMNDIIHAAAAEHGIPVVHAYDAINGPRGQADGVAAGYVSADQLHLTGNGARLLAGMLADLGYEPASG